MNTPAEIGGGCFYLQVVNGYKTGAVQPDNVPVGSSRGKEDPVVVAVYGNVIDSRSSADLPEISAELRLSITLP